MLARISPAGLSRALKDPVDAATLAAASQIVEAVKSRGRAAVEDYAARFDGWHPTSELVLGREALAAAHEALPVEDRALLGRVAARVRAFAEAQRAALAPLAFAIPGGLATHEAAPVDRAGCYAPGGRFPLPSTVIMTAATARAAGVQEVIVASPRPATVTLAAAYAAGADAVAVVGGAQAIAMLAYGGGVVPPCDVIVGPGNRWVTAAKKIVAGDVGIDMLAGPSELVVLADGSADASVIAADLLAQAEHDTDAMPALVTTSTRLADAVDAELARQLETLPTAETARAALRNGVAVIAASLDEAIAAVNRIAPEHLQVMLADDRPARAALRHYGAAFWGPASAEVLGDYGAGPNHTLPTGGRARFSAGLSVFHFLRIRTGLDIRDAAAARGIVEDSVRLARLEGLEAHARAAERRL
jgi:phosphoribosyl-ATP pyrophosphohydrolase/phosphoribosyl-AMP cyclohydrolase/histidinol dehydrogenase